MSVLICGSMAFDTIMVFHDRFKNHILPDKVHILNVSFLVPKLRREFGGCAGNIAYNLKLLGEEALPMATVGKDFGPYREWMDKHGISTEFIRQADENYTAQAYITTDKDDNQITAFHPGAMSLSHCQSVPTERGLKIGTVSPDGKEAMIQHAEEFAEAGIPFIFDPGQGLPMFAGEELTRLIGLSNWVTVNDYEAQLMAKTTGLSIDHIAEQVDAVIVTRGSHGSEIHANNERIYIPPARPEMVLDPTGCGDAFRAGLLYGLLKGLDWETTGRIASLMGALKVESEGTQNHHFTMDEFRDRFNTSFQCQF
ncbi:MAG: carbohydrate kinase family protein [Pseudomonadota bacterium]|nr:carbohydrate kinase family protein [Pseudomonadota bacterium]